VPSTLPAATDLRTCSIATIAKDPRLATFSGYVTDVASGDVLFSRSGDDAVPVASVLKLLTASSAITILGPNYRLTTTVVAGSEPGEIVLVGGGDPTLSRTPVGAESVYQGAPKLADLASQVHAALGTQPITKIVLDASYWNPKDDYDSTWQHSDLTNGDMSKVTALQVDGDRSDPTKSVSPRSADPVMNAGKYFAEALGVPTVPLVTGTAPSGAQQLASVQSQPLSSLINTMLLKSDGSLAESIARVASIAAGSNGSAASLQKVETQALTSLKLDPNGVVIRDGSGLSDKDAVPPSSITALLVKLRAGKNHLNDVYNGLSVAGQSGGLTDRFTGANAVAVGHVTAKVGFIDGAYALAGIVDAEDGSELAFAFAAVGPTVTPTAKPALDTITTAVYKCGDNLTSH